MDRRSTIRLALFRTPTTRVSELSPSFMQLPLRSRVGRRTSQAPHTRGKRGGNSAENIEESLRCSKKAVCLPTKPTMLSMITVDSSPVTHPTQFRASAPLFNGGSVLCRHPDAAMARVSQTGASFWYRNLDFAVFRYQNGGREGASRGDPEAPDLHRTNSLP